MSEENREKLISDIEKFVPDNEQEEKDKALILEYIKNNEDALLRTNPTGHVTASAWVVNRDVDKVLMIYHNIYDSWSWLGGHADGETNLLDVAVKEVKEESGLKNVEVVFDSIYSLEILTVDGHEKNGEYVPSHLHYNVTYLLAGDENDELKINKDENSGVAWFAEEEALAKSTEPWFVERIYSKLIEKTNQNRDTIIYKIKEKEELKKKSGSRKAGGNMKTKITRNDAAKLIMKFVDPNDFIDDGCECPECGMKPLRYNKIDNLSYCVTCSEEYDPIELYAYHFSTGREDAIDKLVKFGGIDSIFDIE